MGINEIVAQWREVYKMRTHLDDLSKQLKEGPEAELRASIMMYLEVNNLSGIKTDDGTVGKKATQRVEIVDLDKLCGYMLNNMNNLKEGMRLADNLLLQKTAHKAEILKILYTMLGAEKDDKVPDDKLNEVGAALGVHVVSKADITFNTKRS